MVFEKDSIERIQFSMYGDMIKDAAKNKGVIFILICFLAMVALAFAVGYQMGWYKHVCEVCYTTPFFTT